MAVVTLPDGTTQEVDYGKSTLFRFSTIHKPEVKVNDPKKPWVTLSPRPSYVYGSSASTLSTVSDIVTFNDKLFYFSEWLAAEDYLPTFDEISLNLEGVATLGDEDSDKVWDSLYQQYNTQAEGSIAKNLVNLARGNAFAVAFNELTTSNPELTDFPDDDEVERFSLLRKSSIGVIEELIPEPEPTAAPPTSLFSPDQQNTLKRKQLAAIAHHRITSIQDFITDFQEVRIIYNKERNEAYQAAVNEHTQQVDQLLENRELIQSLSEKPAREIEGLELPEFNFEFPPFDAEYIKSKECYVSVGEAIEELMEHDDFCGNIDKLESHVEKHLTDARKQFNDNIGLAIPKRISFSDYEIVYDPNPANNSFVVQAIKLFPTHDKLTLVFTQYSRNGGTKIGKISGFVIPDGGTPIEISFFKKIRETDEFITFIIAEEEIEENFTELVVNSTAYSENGEFNQEFSVSVKKDFYVFGPQPFSETSPMLMSMGDGIPGIGDKPMYGIRKIGIKDYMRVEQEVCCYVPGEVSHIENVMAREFRKKLVRDLERQEFITEESEETEHEKTTDNTTTERYELQKEISQMLSKEQSKQIGITAGMNASYNTQVYQLGVNAGTNINFSNSSSQTQGFNQTESIAKEVVQKATERIVKKMSYKRTARMLREHEETNEHGFDNRNGDKHVVGIYRWVDKIYKNTLYNYGKRLQYDFMLPEPAKNFKWWMTKTEEVNKDDEPKQPVHPGSFVDIKNEQDFNWQNVDESNYAKIAAEYGADVEPMPEKMLRIAKSFSENPKGKFPTDDWDEPRDSFHFEIEIPEGYYCDYFSGEFNHVLGHRGTGQKYCVARISIGTSYYKFFRGFTNFGSDVVTYEKSLYPIYSLNVTKALPIGISTFNIGGFSLNVISHCRLANDTINAWKQRTYTAIMAAYHKKLQAFKDAEAAISKPEKIEYPDYNNNPGKNRAIEARELKRLAIETMCFQLGLDYSREGYLNTTSCDNSYLLFSTADLNKHANLVNFLEQAFEWDLISYQFYHYMYADRKLWETLIKQKSTSDPLFEAFLQSGMARMTLTVTPGFEKLVMYFLDTGIVPVSSDFVPGGKEDWYRSIHSMLVVKEKTPVGAPWETRVPTDLVILQSDAAPLVQTGLPCACPQPGNTTHGVAIGQSEMSGSLTLDRGLITEIKEAIIQVASLINCCGSSSGGGSTTTGSSFTFPRSAELTVADIGKIVVNAGDGLASVPVLSPALPPQLGLYKIRFQDIADLQDISTITIENKTTGISSVANRITWRNGNTPTTVFEELDLIKTYFEAIPALSTFLGFSIVDDELIIEETDFQNIRVELDDFPDDSRVIVNVSRPESPAAFTGYPLGKLLAIQGSNAVISNTTIETYTLESAFEVNQNLFVSDGAIDFETPENFAAILNHIIIPAEDGKVQPLGFTAADFTDDFINIYRNQFIGIAIASSGTQVTVAKMPYLSLIFHTARRAGSKGLIFND